LGTACDRGVKEKEMNELVFIHLPERHKSMYLAIKRPNGEHMVLGRLLVKPSIFIDELHDAGVRIIDKEECTDVKIETE
jgi:hypothetical protein